MPNLPAALLQSLQQLPGLHLPDFVAAHAQPDAPVSIRLNPLKPETNKPIFEGMQPVPWSRFGYYLPERPHFAHYPLWHAGSFYVQEASSMILEQALLQHLPANGGPKVLLDLCAAPGGKSTHLLSLISEQDMLVSNEVIGGRVGILLENITRWGAANSVVTQNDPADFGNLPGQFDVVLVDAPCSGSGLFRRDPHAIAEWSPEAVDRCWRRQQRILSDIWPALKEEGLLIYATCSYSPQENEDIVDWLCQTFEATALPLAIPPDSGITASFSPIRQQPCYRFYPHLTNGEGFFMAVMRKKEAAAVPAHYRPSKPSKEEIPVGLLQQHWTITHPTLCYYRHQDVLYAMPAQVHAFYLQWHKTLHIRKAGICIGQWQHQSLQPDHALAMSALRHPDIQRIPLSLNNAQQYLRKDNNIALTANKGWGLPTFEGVPLGWIKHLGNRFNNYYPKEWRLRS